MSWDPRATGAFYINRTDHGLRREASPLPPALPLLRNAGSLSAPPSGTGVWDQLHPAPSSSSPVTQSVFLWACSLSCRLVPHRLLRTHRPLRLLCRSPSSGYSIGSWAMTAPLSFHRSLEAGSGRPSVSTAANPSTTKPLRLGKQ